MKRLISLLLALLMVFALVACGDEAVTDTSSRDASDSDGGSSATSSENGGETDEYNPVKYLNGLSFDEDLEHRIVTIDVLKGSIVVLDLDRGNGDFTKLSDKSAVVWEASVPYACDSGIKFRESELFGDVFLATGSGGDAIAVSYKTKEVVWNVSGIYNAHSIEMLPNGDIIVAASGDSDDDYSDGGLHYFPAGSRKESAFLSLPYAHAVHWDPENNCLWSIGFEGIVSVIVDGEGEDATMVKDPDKCYEMTNFTGHDLAPVYGNKGALWVTTGSHVYQFDKNTKTFSTDYAGHEVLDRKDIKGVGNSLIIAKSL